MALGHSHISCSYFPESQLLMFATVMFSECTISIVGLQFQLFVFTQLFDFEQSFLVWVYLVLTAVQNNTFRGKPLALTTLEFT